MQAFSNQQLNHMATENYRTLRKFCSTLETEGYWAQAEQVLHMKSEQMLEWYVQSLLVCFSSYCRHLSAVEWEFIASLSEKNVLSFTEETEEGQVVAAAEKFQNHPPILYQLLSLRDMEHDSGMAGLFFDGVLNIMLCLSYLDGRREAVATKYLGIYFDKVSMFLQNTKNPGQAVDSKYIFKKLCHGELEKSNDEIIRADGNFELYKRRHLFYRTEHLESVQTAHVAASVETIEEALEQKQDELKKEQQPDEGTKDTAVLESVQSGHLDALIEELNALVG